VLGVCCNRFVNRKHLLDALGPTPRSLSDLAAQLGASRKDVEDALPHIVRSARAAGRRLVIVPARCRSCDFTFDDSKLSKPGRCPRCRGTWVYEPLLGVEN
jgi:transcriptional regulator